MLTLNRLVLAHLSLYLLVANMVRNYKRKTKGSDSVALQADYEDVKKNVSLESAAKENGFDRMTLTRYDYKIAPSYMVNLTMILPLIVIVLYIHH